MTKTTSLAAHASIKGKAAKIRIQVLRKLHAAGVAGMIDEELVAAMGGMKGSTVRTRRSELTDDGLVRDSGNRRPTSSGRLAIVWVTADHFFVHTPPIPAALSAAAE